MSDRSEKIVKFGIKVNMVPNYINAVIGMNNPNAIGFIPENKTYEPFIEKNDNRSTTFISKNCTKHDQRRFC